MKVKDFFSKENISFGKQINIYVCGPTVYNQPHIGNLRPVIIFDIFNRVASLNHNINYIHNITDIDDKIIDRSIELKISEKDVSRKYEKEYIGILNKLNIIKPNKLPRVTDNIPGIIDLVQELIDKGFAYEENGSVYFEIKKLENYGKKDNLNLDKLFTEKNENQDSKRDNKDFALWKKTTKGITYKSPWGKGRPGWHTECAFFVRDNFGDQGIDIHGGGIDLKFPHHINEMAQYTALTNNDLSRSWMYVGHINIDSEKMSKSQNNFIFAKDFIEEFGPNTLRMLLISTHYLKPINLTNELIVNSQNILNKIKNSLRKSLVKLAERNLEIVVSSPTIEVVEALKNDLDISSSLTLILEDVKKLNKENDYNSIKKLVEEIIANLNLLGFKFEINFSKKIRKEFSLLKEKKNYEKSDLIAKEFIK